MMLRLRECDSAGMTLLRGQYATASFTDLWNRAISGGGGDIGIGAMYQSVLCDLEWGQLERSPFLQELRDTTRDGLLSIKFNVDGYNLDAQSPEFTKGRIVGTIGPATADEPRHLVRGRQFMPPIGGSTTQSRINFCVAAVDRKVGKVFLDLGNALPTTQPGGPPVNQGELSMICKLPSDENPDAVQELSLGSIAYTEQGWYESTAGVVALPSDRSLTKQELDLIATNPLTLRLPDAETHPAPAMEEAVDGLYVRADQFVFRLNPGEQTEVRLFATRFGQPYAGAQILLIFDAGQLQGGRAQLVPARPVDAINYPPGVVADMDGVATFVIKGYSPRNPRGYVDGQVYGVRPVLAESFAFRGNNSPNPWHFISLLIFDDFRADEPPTGQNAHP